MWNGKLIAEMDTAHIDNTIAYLEKRAKEDCEHAGEDDLEWYEFLPEEYYALLKERDKRPSLNF